MPDLAKFKNAVFERVLRGGGHSSTAQRQHAFEGAREDTAVGRLTDKVAKTSHAVEESDFAAALAEGATEDEVFELVICAAIGETERRYDAVRSVLARVFEEAP